MCGLAHSTSETTPFSCTILLTLKSPATEWCATASRAAIVTRTATRTAAKDRNTIAPAPRVCAQTILGSQQGVQQPPRGHGRYCGAAAAATRSPICALMGHERIVNRPPESDVDGCGAGCIHRLRGRPAGRHRRRLRSLTAGRLFRLAHRTPRPGQWAAAGASLLAQSP